MDALDRKILAVLDQDARASYSEIGRTVRAKPETARYRVERLFASGIVRRTYALINSRALGYSYYQVLARLQASPDEKDALVRLLVDDPRIGWFALVEGEYDIAFIAVVRTQQELTSLLDDISRAHDVAFLRREVSINLRGSFFARSYLSGSSREQITSPVYEPKIGEVKSDGNDLTILRALARDARISAVALAQRTGLSPDAILFRLRRLREKGVLQGYASDLNHDLLGQLHYKLLLFLKSPSPDVVGRVRLAAASDPRLVACIEVLASWHLEIDGEFENHQQLQASLQALFAAAHGDIIDYRLLRIADVKKYCFLP